MRIGICTGGGDCPGLNAAIRALVQAASQDKSVQIVGIYDSINGLMERPLRYTELTLPDVTDILCRGGTIIGTHNKGNPLVGPEKSKKIEAIKQGMTELKLDTLILIGGEGTQGLAVDLMENGIPIIGIPKTIDNDLPGTDRTIGFASCVDLVAESVLRLRSTAESHDRIMLLEVMGRDSGYIALHGGLAGGAHVILIPEIPFDYTAMLKKIQDRSSRGRNFSVIVVSEGARSQGGDALYKEETSGTKNLGGISQLIARELFQKTNMDTRVTVLGHLQRGGTPNPEDRILAARFAVHAYHLVKQKQFNRIVVLKGQHISDTAYADIARFARAQLSLQDEILLTAEATGICLGR
ncbi:MAG: ATP-dependent 6-phosphofructokinase [Oligoflexales bacterium]|nr:ATP-dependent 6-phosphofructokinase [Oligoflexales bacterium]